MSTRVVRVTLAGAGALAAALLAGAHRPEPMTCSVASVTITKYIAVEAEMAAAPAVVSVKIEPHGPHGTIFTHGRPILISVTDGADKEILRPDEARPKTEAGRPPTARDELFTKVRWTAERRHLEPLPYEFPFTLEVFPSTIKQLKGRADVMTGDEALIPLEIAEGRGAVEISPGVTFTVRKIVDIKGSRLADWEIRIRRIQGGDGSALEPLVAALVHRKGGKEMPALPQDQPRESETDQDYIVTSQPGLWLGDDTSWEVRLIRNIQRTKVEFECRDLVVRPAR